jgi:eukaryotic-like serine/threonine-protein kinase
MPSNSNAPIPANILCAAEMLEGTQLNNGWLVTIKIPQAANSTGGNFSVPYIAERVEGKNTKRAFLKALNFRRLAAAPDFSRAVQQHTTAFNFERDTLHLCKEKGLRRIARLLDAGEYRPNNCPLPVCYIIFELAEGGDARKQIAKLGAVDLAWTLRSLHSLSVGLRELHTHGIAHQDLKPSNVLFFEAFGAKLADLGCADTEQQPSASPRGGLGVAGDPSYAPPELLYNEVSLDWKVRRLGCDLYLLGSLVAFFFTGGASMTALWQSLLHPSHSFLNWTQDYRSALPYIRDAFERALLDVSVSIPESVRNDIVEIIHYLCEPDPRRRGHPKDLDGHQFNLERVISSFNLLATKAEFELVEQ